ncbi:MAG: crosslink repair DNA glycosylase YcaQ family protein [Pseudomonadota bacterium]
MQRLQLSEKSGDLVIACAPHWHQPDPKLAPSARVAVACVEIPLALEPHDSKPAPPSVTLSARQARRIALGAQGFADPYPSGRRDRRHLARVLGRVKLLQIDSVTALLRAHYLPAFARIGPYPRALLDNLTQGRRRSLFEYWGHEASFIPLEHHPLFRWRMVEAQAGQGLYRELARFGQEQAALVADTLARVEAEGPLSASDFEEGRGSGGWWGWSARKQALELLFWQGLVTAASRRRSFERLYDLPERVLPPDILALPTPEPEEAQRRLLLLAAEALGVATEVDLRAYVRMDAERAKLRLAELLEAEALLPAQVKGWDQPAYLHPEALRPRRFTRAVLLSPFDSLVWERPRCERLFNFHYRLEFYTPEAKRRYGYYVMPFLLGDALVGRVALKSDHAGGRLQVTGAFAEPGQARPEIAEALNQALHQLAAWLDLPGVHIDRNGDLAALLPHKT